MNHLTLPRFWQAYYQLPKDIQIIADKNYKLLENNPSHPSLHFKKVGNRKQLWAWKNQKVLSGSGLASIVTTIKY